MRRVIACLSAILFSSFAFANVTEDDTFVKWFDDQHKEEYDSYITLSVTEGALPTYLNGEFRFISEHF